MCTETFAIQNFWSLASTYTYDGDGLKRSSQEVTSGRTTLVWDGTDYLQGRLTEYANASMFDSHNFPSELATGAKTTVTVTFRNTGTNTWTAAAGYRLGTQAPQDNNRWGSTRGDLDSAASVAPGQIGTFTYNVTAPATPGTYAMQFRVLLSGVAWFGAETPLVWVKVV